MANWKIIQIFIWTDMHLVTEQGSTLAIVTAAFVTLRIQQHHVMFLKWNTEQYIVLTFMKSLDKITKPTYTSSVNNLQNLKAYLYALKYSRESRHGKTEKKIHFYTRFNFTNSLQ